MLRDFLSGDDKIPKSFIHHLKSILLCTDNRLQLLQGTHAHPHGGAALRLPVLQLQGNLVGRAVPPQAEGPPAAVGGEGEERQTEGEGESDGQL